MQNEARSGEGGEPDEAPRGWGAGFRVFTGFGRQLSGSEEFPGSDLC